jgi:pimeloyl-ACP methyl ester carboxylesterase
VVRAAGFGLILLALAFAVTGAVHDPDPAPLRLRRETVTVDGTRLSYHRTGAGRDVVLLHGGMGSVEDWEPILPKLVPTFRVTVVDRPGFGLSQGGRDDVTYPGNARLVAGLVATLGLERPVIVGHSHGGGVALAIAETYPEVPGALVLIASAAFPGGSPDVLDRLTALPLIGEGITTWLGPSVGPPTIARVLHEMLGPDTGAVPADFVSYRQQLWTTPRSLTAHARQQMTDPAGLEEIAANLHRVRVPTIVFGCDGDPTEGGSVDSRRLTREIEGSRLWWLSGCGHYIQYRHPDRIVAAIAEAIAPARPPNDEEAPA